MSINIKKQLRKPLFKVAFLLNKFFILYYGTLFVTSKAESKNPSYEKL